MPRGNPQYLKRVPKGGPSPNPAGRKPDMFGAHLKKLSIVELEEIANLIVKGNVEQLRAVAKDPKSTVIKTMLAAACVKIITKGDMHALDQLLNRLVGKVKDTVEHKGLPANVSQVVAYIPENGRLNLSTVVPEKKE